MIKYLILVALLCKNSVAMTKWRKSRDRILLDYLRLQSESSKILILVNSINDVNMTLAWLRSTFNEDSSIEESKFAGIGRSSATIATLQADFAALLARPARIMVLSASVAILGLFHGFFSLSTFDSIVFSDARGANQSHPFCLVMNHFYTPLRIGCQIIGFSRLPRREEVEADVFSRREWLRQLRHWNRTFQSVLVAVDDNTAVVDEFLDSHDAVSICFEPLNMLETCITKDKLSWPDTIIVNNKEELAEALASPPNKLVLNNFLCNTAQDAVELLDLLERLKSSGIERVIHCHSKPEFVGLLSMIALQRRLHDAEAEETGRLQELIRQSESLLGQQIHFESTLDVNESLDTSSFMPPPPNTKLPIPISSLSFHSLPHLRLESGALACPFSAIGFLVRACTLLPLDPSSGKRQSIRLKTHRVFPVTEKGQKITTSAGFICQLFLPSALKELCGSASLQGTLQVTRLAAQASVALKATLLLRQKNILDEYFMLADEHRATESIELESEDVMDAEADAGSDDESDDSNADALQLSFNEIIPQSLLLQAAKESLYTYALEYSLLGETAFTMTPDSRILHYLPRPQVDMFNCRESAKSWAILLPSKLPDDFLPVQVPLGSQHCLQVQLKPLGKIEMTSPEYERLLRAQPLLFNLFNMRPLTAPPLEDESIDISASTVPENKLPFYLIAPLIDGQAEERSFDLSHLHAKFLEFIADFQATPFEGAQIAIPDADEACRKNWTFDWNLIAGLEEHDSNVNCDNLLAFLQEIEEFTKHNECPSLQLEEGAPPLTFTDFCLHSLVLHTPHTHTLYRAKHLANDVNPGSPSPMSVSFAEYAQSRYGLRTENANQPLLQVHRPENWSDLAVWGSIDGAQKKRNKSSRQKRAALPGEHRSLLIPEHVNILPIGYAQVRIAMLIPRVAGEVERQLRISEFFSQPQLSALPRPSHARAVEAMTSNSVALSYSYERLEVLGDSLLKHLSTLQTFHGRGSWNEGRLSTHRQSLLSNANLRSAGERIGVFYYASFTPFLARLWTASPALQRLLLSSGASSLTNATTSHSSYKVRLSAVRIKTIFDEEDRWRALAALEGKHSQKIGPLFLSQSGMLQQPPSTQLQTRAEKKGSADVLFRHGQAIPPKKIADVVEALLGAYYLDCGVMGAIGFLHAVGVIDSEVVTAALFNASLKAEFFSTSPTQQQDEDDEALHKLKRRKLTPLTAKIIELAPKSHAVYSSVNIKLSPASLDLHQQIANTAPVMTPFDEFPFAEIEAVLGYRFEDRRLLFAAFSHCTAAVDDYGDFERLEWVGDAALDFMICRVFWYSLDDCDLYPREREISLLTIQSPEMDPDALTRARQSIINNDALASIISHFKLHSYLRINAPYLQQEVAKYTNSPNSSSQVVSQSLQDLDNPLSMTAPKVLADVFEALAGAILIDCGCDDVVFCRVMAKFFNWYRSQNLHAQQVFCTNPIEQLLHWYARLGVPRNHITCTFDQIGQEKVLGFVGRVWVRERCVGEAQAASRQLAKRMAMEDALERLKRDGWRDHL